MSSHRRSNCKMAAKEEPQTVMKRDFSRVILTLDNVLVPPDKLSPTPSMQDGLDSETEMDLRILGCELIQTAGILLKLPQVGCKMAATSDLYNICDETFAHFINT